MPFLYIIHEGIVSGKANRKIIERQTVKLKTFKKRKLQIQEICKRYLPNKIFMQKDTKV